MNNTQDLATLRIKDALKTKINLLLSFIRLSVQSCMFELEAQMLSVYRNTYLYTTAGLTYGWTFWLIETPVLLKIYSYKNCLSVVTPSARQMWSHHEYNKTNVYIYFAQHLHRNSAGES